MERQIADLRKHFVERAKYLPISDAEVERAQLEKQIDAMRRMVDRFGGVPDPRVTPQTAAEAYERQHEEAEKIRLLKEMQHSHNMSRYDKYDWRK